MARVMNFAIALDIPITPLFVPPVEIEPVVVQPSTNVLKTILGSLYHQIMASLKKSKATIEPMNLNTKMILYTLELEHGYETYEVSAEAIHFFHSKGAGRIDYASYMPLIKQYLKGK